MLSSNKKLNLSRFKKSMQGLIDFAVLLEQAESANRESLIDLASRQDAEFLHRVMRKVVFYEELVYLDESILAELLSAVTPKILAYSMEGMSDEFKKTLQNHLGYREMRALQEEQEKMKTEHDAAFIAGARKQILKIARQLEGKGRFVFELNECPRFKLKRREVG